eukprot:5286319-Prymnesium_polylepis.1
MSIMLTLGSGEACAQVSATPVPVTDLQTINERSHLIRSNVGACSGRLGVVRRQTIGHKSQKIARALRSVATLAAAPE